MIRRIIAILLVLSLSPVLIACSQEPQVPETEPAPKEQSLLQVEEGILIKMPFGLFWNFPLRFNTDFKAKR
jgi:hypothetical protein